MGMMMMTTMMMMMMMMMMTMRVTMMRRTMVTMVMMTRTMMMRDDEDGGAAVRIPSEESLVISCVTPAARNLAAADAPTPYFHEPIPHRDGLILPDSAIMMCYFHSMM